MPEKKTNLTLTVNVRLEQVREKQLPELTAYVFDGTGQFVAAKPMQKGEQGQVKLELPPELTGTTARLVLGPPLDHEKDDVPPWMTKLIRRNELRMEAASLAHLARKGGYEKRVSVTATGAVVDVRVFPHDWVKWLLCPCVVRGRLVKRIPLPDGTIKELGVCHACVKIYEVDKIPKIILRLSERELFRLRDDLWRMAERPLPPLPPEHEGLLDPRASRMMAAMGAWDLESRVATPVIPLPPPRSPEALPSLAGAQFKAELQQVFQVTSASQLRSALVAKAEMLALCLCSIKWLWYYFHADFIKCCCTDEQGRFETTIWYMCTGDKPDLYFKAVQCIGGDLHILYDPGVACHTYWNYVCGSEVVLETQDPAAITCISQDPVTPPLGVSLWIMPYAVGGVRLDLIKPRWAKDGGWHTIDPDGTRGLTDFTDGSGTWVDAPFGDTLGFRLGYSSAIPYDVAGKPAYYRWLYTQLDNAGNETEWREFAPPVATTVVRHYVDTDQAHPDLPPTFPAYPLGPQQVGNMHVYEFKPHLPPQMAGHQREWPVDDWFNDIYSGILQTTSLPGGVSDAAGTYKIKLEIYDKSANQIAPGPGTFSFIVPIGLAADGVTVLTRKAEAIEIEGDGYTFYLHVDNNKCEAVIFDAIVNDVGAGPCGFISYNSGDDVHLSFKAKHTNGFARFKFTVVRGSAGYVGSACAPANPSALTWSTSPLVTDNPNGYVHDAASVFAKDVDESDMRNDCPKAAFGEDLYVAATATNGWVRLSGLDASALPKAFALEPKTT